MQPKDTAAAAEMSNSIHSAQAWCIQDASIQKPVEQMNAVRSYLISMFEIRLLSMLHPEDSPHLFHALFGLIYQGRPILHLRHTGLKMEVLRWYPHAELRNKPEKCITILHAKCVKAHGHGGMQGIRQAVQHRS